MTSLSFSKPQFLTTAGTRIHTVVPHPAVHQSPLVASTGIKGSKDTRKLSRLMVVLHILTMTILYNCIQLHFIKLDTEGGEFWQLYLNKPGKKKTPQYQAPPHTYRTGTKGAGISANFIGDTNAQLNGKTTKKRTQTIRISQTRI